MIRDELEKKMRSRNKDIKLQVQAHNVFLISELSKILSAFGEGNIHALIMKGTGLLETLYKKGFSRPMYDLDILVKKKDLKRAEECLIQLGYHFLSYNGGNHKTYCKEKPLFIPVEVHWDLFKKNNPLQRYAFQIDTEDFWKNALPIKINGVIAQIMSPENLIIYLACHLLKESYSHQKWFIDIDRIIRHYKKDMDWGKVLEKAEKYKVKVPIWYALSYIYKFYDTPLPEGLLKDLTPKRLNWWQNGIAKRIFCDKPLQKWHLLPLYMSAIKTAKDRRRAFIKLFPYLFNTAPNFPLSWRGKERI